MQFRFAVAVVLLGMLSLAITGCAVQKIDGIKRYDNSQFAKKLQSGKYTLLDVRTSHEYDSAHIPNATLLNFKDTLAFAAGITQLDPAKKYLLYCRTGKRSIDAARLMRAQGIKKVGDLKRGMSKWDGDKTWGKQNEK